MIQVMQSIRRTLFVGVLGLATTIGTMPTVANPANRNDPMALPSLGDASSRTISPELERQIGESFLKQLHGQVNTSDDPIIKYYVERQITELAQYSDLREGIMNVIVVDNPNINAFAAPGGVVGINLGLLLYAEDVHEYSSVIAHELAHLSQRHFARGVEEQRAQSIPLIASLIAAIIIGVAGGGNAAIAALGSAQAAAQASQLRYSRSRETEADRVGFNTLVRANHDPAAMSRMFERMQRAYRFTRKPPEFLLTHPLSETRIADARNQALDVPRGNYKDSVDYQLMRTRAEVHYQKNPAQGAAIYRNKLRDNPSDLAASYGLALSLSNNEEHDKALAIAQDLVQVNPQSILYQSAYAELLINADQLDQARENLSHRLVLNPDNAPLSALYAQALSLSGRYEEAEDVLERQSLKRPRDVDVWYNLAEVAGLAGNITGVHLARAEYFYLHGAYNRSIQHLEYAQRLVKRTNSQLNSKLSQRIQDLRTAIRVAQS